MATMYDPPHLGELIRESMEAEGWTVTATAERLGVSRVALSRVLNGRASVSAALALALERIGWSDAEHWMRMQAIYAVAQERRKQAEVQRAPARSAGGGRPNARYVRPAKAGAFSGRQTRRGKSQKETDDLKLTDTATGKVAGESPGRNESERTGGHEKVQGPEAESA